MQKVLTVIHYSRKKLNLNKLYIQATMVLNTSFKWKLRSQIPNFYSYWSSFALPRLPCIFLFQRLDTSLRYFYFGLISVNQAEIQEEKSSFLWTCRIVHPAEVFVVVVVFSEVLLLCFSTGITARSMTRKLLMASVLLILLQLVQW